MRRNLSICLGIAFALAFAFIAAPRASAAEWKAGGAPLIGSATYSTTAAGPFTLNAMFPSETEVALTATGVESIGSSIANGGSEGRATATGKLKFSGVTISGVPNCKVSGGTVETKALAMEPIVKGGKTYESFKPAEGETFWTVKIEKTTGSCPIAGSYSLQGSFFAQIEAAATEQVTHAFAFSAAIQKEAGGSLKFGGGGPASFSGSLNETLTGTHAGQAWSVG
jgi:hypothetical protein